MEQFNSAARILVILFLFVSSNPVNGRSDGDGDGDGEGDGEGASDKESLALLKQHLVKQSFSTCLSSWNDSNRQFCAWPGVSCHRKFPARVAGLNLSSCSLAGPLPPAISNLTFLQSIDLSFNHLSGEIPPSILSPLRHLHRLNLRSNSLHGSLPTNLSSKITALDLSRNNFSGNIPSSFFLFKPNLKHLRIDKNQCSGIIPASIGNLSSLKSLNLMENNFEGSIPRQIGSLPNLLKLTLSLNNLSGTIPPPFYNISNLRTIEMAENNLSGGLSPHMASYFPYLEILYMADNKLSGSLQALSNFTSFVQIDLPVNQFTGRVPPDLGNSRNLNSLNLEQNELEADDAESWKFVDSLTNCTALQVLSLDVNNFGGFLPKSIANLSIQLQFLSIGRNPVKGNIPPEIVSLVNLNLLAMEFSNITGTIPEDIGRLKMLQELSFGNTGLRGAIPLSLTNLTGLSQLDLGDNKFTGEVPPTIGQLQNLNFLNLEHNNLIGSIPEELFSISALSDYLGLAGNYFVGTLSPDIGKLVSLNVLDLSANNLTGRIPEELGDCKSLTNLYMDQNLFDSSIPTSIENLKSLKIMNLSRNNLSGAIPALQNLRFLQVLDLSYNNLEGEVPNSGVFQNSSEISIDGNSGLCGGISELHLPTCRKETKKRSSHHLLWILILIISTILALFLLVAFIILYKYRKRRQASEETGIAEPFPKISYAELFKATNEFSSANLIGRGSYGSVYKGLLQEGQVIVAIKVFNLDIPGGFRSFTAECEALRNVRHRNLVRVLTSCSSMDFKGADFKALVFEFMPKGNLETWLHREGEGEVVLNLEQRLNIAADGADALEYLHHSCQPPIIHFDMKPSNILLDDDMTAHVGDFGLSRFLPEAMSMSLQETDSKSAIKGTIGYVAPEYGGGARPSTSADVYSFGILLLEMLTGRRPTDDMFSDGLDLHKYVEMKFPHGIIDILDFKIVPNEQDDRITSNRKNCIISLAEIGLSCSDATPGNRPDMRDIAAKIHEVKLVYLQSKRES